MSLIRFATEKCRQDFIKATQTFSKAPSSSGLFCWLSAKEFDEVPLFLILSSFENSLTIPTHIYVDDFEEMFQAPSFGLSNTYEAFHHPNKNLFFYYLYNSSSTHAKHDILKTLPWLHNNYSLSTSQSLM